MKQIICKVEYDTEQASLINKKCYGAFGDPKGYEETLYLMPTGQYFIYCFGGEESPYPKEKIKRISKANAEKWS